jgi:hypothetical protein
VKTASAGRGFVTCIERQKPLGFADPGMRSTKRSRSFWADTRHAADDIKRLKTVAHDSNDSENIQELLGRVTRRSRHFVSRYDVNTCCLELLPRIWKHLASVLGSETATVDAKEDAVELLAGFVQRPDVDDLVLRKLLDALRDAKAFQPIVCFLQSRTAMAASQLLLELTVSFTAETAAELFLVDPQLRFVGQGLTAAHFHSQTILNILDLLLEILERSDAYGTQIWNRAMESTLLALLEREEGYNHSPAHEQDLKKIRQASICLLVSSLQKKVFPVDRLDVSRFFRLLVRWDLSEAGGYLCPKAIVAIDEIVNQRFYLNLDVGVQDALVEVLVKLVQQASKSWNHALRVLANWAGRHRRVGRKLQPLVGICNKQLFHSDQTNNTRHCAACLLESLSYLFENVVERENVPALVRCLTPGDPAEIHVKAMTCVLHLLRRLVCNTGIPYAQLLLEAGVLQTTATLLKRQSPETAASLQEQNELIMKVWHNFAIHCPAAESHLMNREFLFLMSPYWLARLMRTSPRIAAFVVVKCSPLLKSLSYFI